MMWDADAEGAYSQRACRQRGRRDDWLAMYDAQQGACGEGDWEEVEHRTGCVRTTESERCVGMFREIWGAP
jgi:hypothetical protein